MINYARDAVERVVSGTALAAISALAPYALLQDVDWRQVLGTVGLFALLATLKVIGAKGVAESDTASLVNLRAPR